MGKIKLNEVTISDLEQRIEIMQKESNRMKAIAGIQEGEKKFLSNESFSSENEKKNTSQEESEVNESNFIIMEFPQKNVEPGEDDDKLYTLKK